jgi:hypothetical protein
LKAILCDLFSELFPNQMDGCVSAQNELTSNSMSSTCPNKEGEEDLESNGPSEADETEPDASHQDVSNVILIPMEEPSTENDSSSAKKKSSSGGYLDILQNGCQFCKISK